jgi:predicted nucleic acid-binding protein
MRGDSPKFLDTNILVYEWDERDLRKQEIARLLVLEVGRQGVVSSQVLQEFASVMRTKLKANSTQIQSIMGSYRRFGFVGIDHDLIHGALDLAEKHALSFWDGLIVEAAMRSGCKTLYTEDLGAGQVLQGVKIVNPFSVDRK